MMLLPENFDGFNVHFVGVKGTGMCALAELLVALGARVSGSDVEEEFYTDAILADIGVSVGVFNASLDETSNDVTVTKCSGRAAAVGTDGQSLLGDDVEFVIRSAAYDESNAVVAEAYRRGLPILSYPEALGELSCRYEAVAVAGVHGKTTTAAMAGILIRALELPATVVVGSAVRGFGERDERNLRNFPDVISGSQDAVPCDDDEVDTCEAHANVNAYRSVWRGGDRFLVAETCEYRRHFLHFFPNTIVLSSVESDHQDYFPDYASISLAFVEFCSRLPEGGRLIYCFDNDGARDVATQIALKRSDIRMIPYGTQAVGKWRVEIGNTAGKDSGSNLFRLDAFDCDFQLKLPGRHSILDAAAALALVHSLCVDESERNFDWAAAKKALVEFRGSRRRSEIISKTNGLLVMDDYAHHPTSIVCFLRGLRDFYPDWRLIVDFMPHTYSRTVALIEEFASCFDCVDVLLLHPVYSSAREKYDGTIDGFELWKRVSARRGKLKGGKYEQRETFYCETLDQAAHTLGLILRAGDLFVTLGAGNNRSLGLRVSREYGGLTP